MSSPGVGPPRDGDPIEVPAGPEAVWDPLWADLELAEVRLAISSAHPAFSDRLTSQMQRVGLPCEVEAFTDIVAFRRALAARPFDAAIVDHRSPDPKHRLEASVAGFPGLKVAVTTPNRFGEVHDRFDRVLPVGDTLRLAVLLATLSERRRARAATHEADAARRRAERRLGLLQEVSSTAVIYLTAGARIDSCNGAAERLLGLPEARIRQQSLPSFVPALTPRQLASSDSWGLVADVRRPGGDELPVEVRGFPLPDGGTAVLIDAEGGSRAHALQASQRRLELLAEMLPGLVYILKVDASGSSADRFLWVGPGAERTLGEAPERTRASTRQAFLDRIELDDRPTYQAFLERAARSSGTESVEHRFAHPDGRTIWLRHYATAVGSRERDLAALYGLMLDVTEENRARARSELLAAVVEQTSDMVVITSTEGTIEYVNPAFEGVTGYTPAEAIGENPRLMNSGRVPSEVYSAMYEALARGDSWDAVFENRRKDGTEYRQEATLSPVTDRFGTTRYVSIARELKPERVPPADPPIGESDPVE